MGEVLLDLIERLDVLEAVGASLKLISDLVVVSQGEGLEGRVPVERERVGRELRGGVLVVLQLLHVGDLLAVASHLISRHNEGRALLRLITVPQQREAPHLLGPGSPLYFSGALPLGLPALLDLGGVPLERCLVSPSALLLSVIERSRSVEPAAEPASSVELAAAPLLGRSEDGVPEWVPGRVCVERVLGPRAGPLLQRGAHGRGLLEARCRGGSPIERCRLEVGHALANGHGSGRAVVRHRGGDALLVRLRRRCLILAVALQGLEGLGVGVELGVLYT